MIKQGSGVVEAMVGEAEKTRETAPVNEDISQQESRDLLSKISENRNYEELIEETYEDIIPPPTPASPPTTRESTAAIDDFEETITLRPPMNTTPVIPPPHSQPAPTPNEEAPGGAYERPQRIHKPIDLFKPASWKALVASTREEPRTLPEALLSAESSKWRRAWESEFKSLEEYGTWALEELSLDRKAIGCRWVFKIQEDGRFSTRLVGKGYSQRIGVDYQETYAPVANFTTLRNLKSLVNENDWELDGMDVKTAFLHMELAKTIYMEIPEGIKTEEGGTPRLACWLIKTIYGLKQSLKAWYGKIHTFFIQNGFVRSEEDHSLYIHETRGLIILVYVDDMLLATSSRESIVWAKTILHDHFDMTDPGEPTTFIGVEISRNRSQRTLKVSQEAYIGRILALPGMKSINSDTNLLLDH